MIFALKGEGWKVLREIVGLWVSGGDLWEGDQDEIFLVWWEVDVLILKLMVVVVFVVVREMLNHESSCLYLML